MTMGKQAIRTISRKDYLVTAAVFAVFIALLVAALLLRDDASCPAGERLVLVGKVLVQQCR